MPGRMGKRMSQAPRMSIVNMAGVDEPERKQSVRDFLCAHVKTIVTIIMIFGTILCIVLIVMVHKWTFEKHHEQHVQACLDVAVIGGGISGTYAAWRLRHSNQKIHVFDMVSERLGVGGRFRTHLFPELGGHINAELGAVFFIPQRDPLLNHTIHALRLTPVTFRRPNPGQPIFYLRGRHLRTSDLNTASVPYQLPSHEFFMYPEDLKSNVESRPLAAMNQDGVHLYKLGYWNVLLGKGGISKEGLNFIQDTSPWRSFVSNGNAALLASSKLDWLHDQMETVKEGMTEIPRRLMDEFLNASVHHELRLNRRLGCIRKEDGYYELTFIKTYTRQGEIKNKRSKEDVCAKKVIFAMPAEALWNVNWQWFENVKKNNLMDRIRSVEAVPALTMYFSYNKTWWPGLEPPITEVITDLPSRWVRYVGWAEDAVDPDTTNHLFMVANVNGADVDYFRSMMDVSKGSYRGAIRISCNSSMQVVKDINRQLAKIYRVPESEIPIPSALVIYDWSQTQAGGGHYVWRRGVKWESEAEAMLRPMYNEDVYVVGSAYCPGRCQLWAEGALQTVDRVLNKYFNSYYIT